MYDDDVSQTNMAQSVEDLIAAMEAPAALNMPSALSERTNAQPRNQLEIFEAITANLKGGIALLDENLRCAPPLSLSAFTGFYMC